MVSIKTIEKIVYNQLEEIDIEKLKDLHNETVEALISREAGITEITSLLAKANDDIQESYYMKKFRSVSESHKILKARLAAIDLRIEEAEEPEEEEAEEFQGFSVPSVPDNVMFM